MKALDLMAHTPSTRISSFWEEQLSRLENLVKDSSETQQRWNNLIPVEIKPAAGKLQLPALMSLMLQNNLGGSRWLQQFLFGFRLTGTLSQKHVFPQKDKLLGKKPRELAKIAKTNEARYTDRASKAGYKNAPKLWAEAMEQSKAGWLTEPFALSTKGQPYTLKDSNLNIAFRFGVEQSDKLRACDDLRYSLTNLACVVETPIKLASWDHVAEMCHSIASSSHAWHFMKADHEAAYKQLPLDWDQAKLAVVALRSPEDGRWYGFFSRTLLFGAVAAVIHYNVFSRIISELVCRIFGIPMVSYFDDFGAMLPKQLAQQGLQTFTRWCELLGIQLKKKKSETGEKITFLGLLGTFPDPTRKQKLRVTLTPEKADKWSKAIRNVLHVGSISSQELEKLIGKLCFSQTCLFGKFARTQLRCLYRKLHTPRYQPRITKFERMTLYWWVDVIASLQPRIPRSPGRAPNFVIYTDAATSSGKIASLLFKGEQLPPKVLIQAASRAPRFWTRHFRPKNLIFGLEMLAPLAFVWMIREKLKGSTVNLYIDNNNVITSLIRGDSSCDIISAMVACFWRTAEAYSIDIWVGRVSSKRNPADIPTREALFPFPINKRVEFRELYKLLQMTLKWGNLLR